MSFHPKDDVAFQDRSPNDWRNHPATVRLHTAHDHAVKSIRMLTHENNRLYQRVVELEARLKSVNKTKRTGRV